MILNMVGSVDMLQKLMTEKKRRKKKRTLKARDI